VALETFTQYLLNDPDSHFVSETGRCPARISLVTHLELMKFSTHSLPSRAIKLTVIESNNEIIEVVDEGSKGTHPLSISELGMTADPHCESAPSHCDEASPAWHNSRRVRESKTRRISAFHRQIGLNGRVRQVFLRIP
jgi:hypothetical protein